MSEALSRQWTTDDEIVVSRLDHDSNIRPWIQAAGRVGALVRWAEIDLMTGELPTGQYAELVGPRTRLVAVTAASNAIGTRPDVASIAGYAHAVGALCYVDGVHATPHVPVDIAALGADFYATSAYKWSGPHVAAAGGRPGPARDGLAGQARPVLQRGAVAVRARHAAVRRPGGRHRGGGPPGRARHPGRGRRTGRRDPPGAHPRVDGGGRGARGRAVRPAARRAREAGRRDRVRPGRPARADRVLQRRRGRPPGGGRAPVVARRQRVGRRQLRVRALPGARPPVRRGGPGRPRPLQRRVRRRPPAVRRGRDGRQPGSTGRHGQSLAVGDDGDGGREGLRFT